MKATTLSQTTHHADQKNLIARIDKLCYKPQMDFLIENHGFKDLYLLEKRKRIKGASEILWEFVQYTFFIFRNLKTFRKADIIVSHGWTSLVLKTLIKLKIIRCNNFFWLGFFLHNKKIFPFIKYILKITSIKNEVFIVHSNFDTALYHTELGIKLSKLKVLPYGDWKDINIEKPAPVAQNDAESYYFAGGYTDRDYQSLIKAFEKIDQKLIIVGSHLNKDLNVKTTENIEIQKDIDKKSFHQLVRNAKVCILPMKHATGASGHMVLLNYMKEGKAVIATDVPGLKDYISPNESAIIVKDIVADLPIVIEKLENNPEEIYRLQLGAIDFYKNNFNKDSLSKTFSNIIFSNHK